MVGCDNTSGGAVAATPAREFVVAVQEYRRRGKESDSTPESSTDAARCQRIG